MSQLKKLFGWGNNGNGQLGLGDTTQRTTPTELVSNNNFIQATGGGSHSLAITTNGQLWAWGANSNGQLGLGNTDTPLTTPTRVGTASNWAFVTAGNAQSLAITTNGELWAWGNNGNGQLGLGDTTQRTTPTRVGTATNWAKVSAGQDHTLAVTTNGQLWAWGASLNGQLGLNTTFDRPAPVRIGTATNWADVSAANLFSLAITTNGELWASGSNTSGRTGLNTTTGNTTVFTRIGTASNWVRVWAATSNGYAINSLGELWTWGTNSEGSTGLGLTSGNTLVPTRVGTENNWVKVTGSAANGYAINSLGELWTWGPNGNGRTGIDLTTGVQSTPIRVGTSNLWTDTVTFRNSFHALAFQIQLVIVEFNASLASIGSVNVNAIKVKNAAAGLSATLSLSIEAQVSSTTPDQFYIDPGYIDQGYYVYIAEGAIDLESEFTLEGGPDLGETREFEINMVSDFDAVTQAGKITDSQITAQASFSQTATISHIQGADLFAFGEAQLAALANRIRDNNIAAESAFDIATDYIRIIQGLVNADSQFDLDSDVVRIRNAVSALDAAFSIDVEQDKILDADITALAEVNLAVTATRIKSLAADLAASADLNTVIGSIKQGEISAGALFDPAFEVNVLVNTFAVLDATATLTAQANRTRDNAAAVSSSFQQSTATDRIRDNDVAAVSEFTQATATDRIRDTTVTVDAEFTQATAKDRFRDNSIAANSEFTQDTATDRTRDNDVAANSVFSQTATVFRQQPGSAALASQATITIDAVKTTDIVSEHTALFVQTAEPVKTVDAIPALTSIATKLAVAFKNATGTILIEPRFSQSTLIGKIHREPTIGSFINGVRFKQSNTETPNTTTFGDKFIVFGRQFENFNLANAGNPLSTYAIGFWGKDLDGKMLSQVVGFWGGQGGSPGIIFNKPQRKVTIEQQYGTGVVWDGVDSHGWRHYLFVQKSGPGSQGVQLFVDGVESTQRTLKTGFFQGTPITTNNIQIFPESGWMLGGDIAELGRQGDNTALRVRPCQGALRQFVVYYDRPEPSPDSGFGGTTFVDDGKPEYPDFFEESNRLKLFNNQFVDIGPIGTGSGLPWPNVYIPLDNSFEITSTTNKGNSWGWIIGEGTGFGADTFRYRSLPGTWRESVEFFTPDGTLTQLTRTAIVSASDFTNEYTPMFVRARLTVGVTTVSLFIGGIIARATLSFEGTLIKDFTADLAVTAELLAAPRVDGILVSELQAETALEAINQRVRFFDSEFTAVTDITAVIGLLQSADITASAEFALTADVAIIDPIRITADISAASTLSTVVGYLRSQNIVIDSTADLDIEVTKIDPIRIDADLAAEFTQTANVEAISDNLINAAAVSTLSADATLIPPIRIDADLFTAATLSASTNYIVDSTAELESLSEVNVDYIRQRDNDITAAATTELDAEPVKFTGIVADLNVLAFKLTAGDVINIDPSLQLKITREQRVLFIEPETRALTILDENRVFYVE